MSVTGIMLWADDFFLTHAPKALLDVAVVVHYYEAILAALAILIWHFYAVIFDPAVYPMSGAWLTGYGSKRAVSAEPSAAQAPVSSEGLKVKHAEVKEAKQSPAPGAPNAGPEGQGSSGDRERERARTG